MLETKSESKNMEPRFSNVSELPKSPGGLVQTQLAGPHPRASDSLGVGWGPRICIFNKSPSDADASGPSPAL